MATASSARLSAGLAAADLSSGQSFMRDGQNCRGRQRQDQQATANDVVHGPMSPGMAAVLAAPSFSAWNAIVAAHFRFWVHRSSFIGIIGKLTLIGKIPQAVFLTL
jgi:hypothetical protein